MMNKLCTIKEIAKALGITERAASKRARKESWPFEERDGRGRGGKVKLYLFHSLHREVRDALVIWELKNLAEANLPLPRAEDLLDPGEKGVSIQCRVSSGPREVPGGNGGTVLLPADDQLPVPAQPAARKNIIVPERADKIGLAKYQIVTEWKKTVGDLPYRERGEATQGFLAAYHSGHLLPEAYRLVGEVALKTLYKFDRRLVLARGDYRAALADGRGGWKKHGTNLWRPRIISKEAQQAFLQCWLHPNRPTFAHSFRGACILLKKHGIDENLTETTCRRWLKDWRRRHYNIEVLAREGDKAYIDKCGPYITRDADSLKVGQVLVADGHTFNFETIHPGTGKPCRMKLILFFDWASRMPIGWQILPTENVIGISAALRMAVINLGKIPDIVYLDNGKAFKAKVFTDTDPDFEELIGIYGRLGIAVMFALPYGARSKVIERFFRTVGYQCEELMPSFCGADIKDKPAWRLRNEKFHRAWHEARTAGWVPNLRETAHILSLYFRWYAEQPHDGLGGKRPIDVFMAGRGSGVDIEELNREFLWTHLATPRHCRVRLHGIDYEADCLHGLAPEPKSVVVRYDTADLSRIWCWLRATGEYLGEALPVQALGPIVRLIGDEMGIDQVKAALARQRQLVKETKKGLAELGLPEETVEALSVVGWEKRMVVLDGGRDASSTDAHDEIPANAGEITDGREDGAEDAMPEAERQRLQLVLSRAEEEMRVEAAKPPLERPVYFDTEWRRYEWCFQATCKHHMEIGPEDKLFMTYFEGKDDWENYRQGYEDLKELYRVLEGGK